MLNWLKNLFSRKKIEQQVEEDFLDLTDKAFVLQNLGPGEMKVVDNGKETIVAAGNKIFVTAHAQIASVENELNNAKISTLDEYLASIGFNIEYNKKEELH